MSNHLTNTLKAKLTVNEAQLGLAHPYCAEICAGASFDCSVTANMRPMMSAAP